MRSGANLLLKSVAINAMSTSLLMQHCRKAEAALVVSSTPVYTPDANVWHLLGERTVFRLMVAHWQAGGFVPTAGMRQLFQLMRL